MRFFILFSIFIIITTLIFIKIRLRITEQLNKLLLYILKYG
jgi:hypothetical protein